MKKKLSLDELSRCMHILDREEQKSLWGGLDKNDCMWRCISYILTNGQNYSAQDAMSLARDYATSNGQEFDENNYAFKGKRSDYTTFMKDYFSNKGYSGPIKRIMVFNPNTTQGFDGEEGYNHAVIVEGFDEEGNVKYFDPQNGTSGTIKRTDLDNSTSFILTAKPQKNEENSYNGNYFYSVDIDEGEDYFDY